MRKYVTSYLIHILPYHHKRRRGHDTSSTIPPQEEKGAPLFICSFSTVNFKFFINGKAIQFKVVIDSPLESVVAPTLASYGLEVSECYFLSRPTSKPLRTNCPFTEVLAIEVNLGLKGGGK